jgi:nucleotidyltransferase substrate binding protein (TIGR01987 family)
MSDTDIRWKQRFQNLEKSIILLESALKIQNPDIIQKAGLIQFFEMCFELSWNLLKDYLQEQGYHEINSPRNAIKKGFETGLIMEGHTWLKLLEDRNITSHIYDEESVSEIELVIRQKYYPVIKELYLKIKNML